MAIVSKTVYAYLELSRLPRDIVLSSFFLLCVCELLEAERRHNIVAPIAYLLEGRL